MGRLNIIINDEVEKRFRVKVAEKYTGEKGALSKAVVDAIELWLKQDP